MKSRGFTLIELLVVISIISLLSSVVLTSLNSARAKARDARRLADIQQIKLALELYYDDNGSYPVSDNWFSGYISAPGVEPAIGLAPYISPPHDPLFDNETGDYIYFNPTGYVNGYAIKVYFDSLADIDPSEPYCKTGVNVFSGWWGATVPMCEDVL